MELGSLSHLDVIRVHGGSEWMYDSISKLFHGIYDSRRYRGSDGVPLESIGMNPAKVGKLEVEPPLDIYSDGRVKYEYPLLNNADRVELTEVLAKINGFRTVIRQAIINRKMTFINSMIISGAPGTGKTHSTLLWVNELIEEGHLDEYQTISGKISPVTLFNYMGQCNEDKVQILDDCDVFYNQESLNILKAGLNTRTGGDTSNDGREVTWGSRGNIAKITYSSFMIMITNEKFDNVTSDHL